jgi:hypothetical protein
MKKVAVEYSCMEDRLDEEIDFFFDSPPILKTSSCVEQYWRELVYEVEDKNLAHTFEDVSFYLNGVYGGYDEWIVYIVDEEE